MERQREHSQQMRAQRKVLVFTSHFWQMDVHLFTWLKVKNQMFNEYVYF